jgi:hypothetical protein
MPVEDFVNNNFEGVECEERALQLCWNIVLQLVLLSTGLHT